MLRYKAEKIPKEARDSFFSEDEKVIQNLTIGLAIGLSKEYDKKSYWDYFEITDTITNEKAKIMVVSKDIRYNIKSPRKICHFLYPDYGYGADRVLFSFIAYSLALKLYSVENEKFSKYLDICKGWVLEKDIALGSNVYLNFIN